VSQYCTTGCGEPTTGAPLCDTCDETFAKNIAELPALAAALRQTITRQVRINDRNGPRNAETAVPFNDKAARARAALLGDLWRWTTTIWNHTDPLPRGGIADLGRWLHTRINTLLDHPDIGDIANTLNRHAAKCWHLTDRPPDRIFAGICSQHTPDGQCVEWLYANPGASVVTCRACGTHHDVNDRREVLRQAAEDVLATAAEVSRSVTWLGEHIKPDRIRQWASRGRLAKRAEDDGKPLYRIGDVLDLLAQTEQKAVS
jgi:hypothetical protein